MTNILAGGANDYSRFPSWVLSFLKANRWLMQIIPAHLYKTISGIHDIPHLGCQYNAGKIVSHMDDIKRVYDILDDDSKDTFLNVLLYRLTVSSEYLIGSIAEEPFYFIDGFVNKTNESIIDCGAYLGDTLEDYCKYNDFPAEAWLIEPDSINFKKLKENIKKYSKNQAIHLINKGVYKNSGKLYFDNGKDIGSYLSETPVAGGSEIDVISIDDLNTSKIDFIKMDIEGSEKDAIEGAKQTILKDYPRLAICIYHSVSDLWEIPLLIKSTFPDYNSFVIKHHSDSFVETILYVQKNRLLNIG